MPYKDKERQRKWHQEYYKLHKKKFQNQNMEWRKKNKEHYKEYQREYSKEYKGTHKEYLQQYNKEYYLENREKVSKRQRKYYKENKGEMNKRSKEYSKNNRKQINKKERNRCKKEPKFRLNRCIRSSIRQSLRNGKNGNRWEDLLGYTLKDLMQHLEKTLPTGMTWQDYLDGKLHIDHIIPIYAFNFDSYNDLDFKRCFALKNLRLLEATENLRKNKKVNKPFQPSLNI